MNYWIVVEWDAVHAGTWENPYLSLPGSPLAVAVVEARTEEEALDRSVDRKGWFAAFPMPEGIVPREVSLTIQPKEQQ